MFKGSMRRNENSGLAWGVAGGFPAFEQADVGLMESRTFGEGCLAKSFRQPAAFHHRSKSV